MLLIETSIFYALLGAGTAIAVWLRESTSSRGARLFQVLPAFIFWPLYMPLLLGTSATGPTPNDAAMHESVQPADELSGTIAQVEAELDAALQSLDGWAENVLSAEAHRLEELRSAWRVQADRIRDLDRLLAQPHVEATALCNEPPHNDRVRRSEEVRLENIRRLHTVRSQLHDDFIGTLAWVRELVTMIHLAKFTGAPASRAEELVAQIAAAVEGLSEVSAWKDASTGNTSSLAERSTGTTRCRTV